MVRRGDGGRVSYVVHDDEDDDNGNASDEDYSDEEPVPRKKAKTPVKKKKPIGPKSKTKGPRGKISPAKTPASKKKLQQQRASSSSVGRASGRAKTNISYADGSESEPESAYSGDEDEDDDDEYERRGKAKKSPAKSPKKGQGRPSPKAKQDGFPRVSEMVLDSIRALKDHPKKGSTLGSIKETISLNWPLNMKIYDAKIKKFITQALESGELIQTKGKGFRGRFTVPGLKIKKRKRKISKKKLEKLDNEVEEDYKPIKTVRDEEREKDREELEQRREERRLWEQEEAVKKANKPKKPVIKKEDYEVEAIRGIRKNKSGQVLYLVKFKGWIKPQWEPEHNVEGCDEAINEFNKLDKQRLKALEERRRQEEADGAYEVKRILEVKFPKNKPREFLIRWVGHSCNDDTWEPEENLNCPDLIEKFMAHWETATMVEEKHLREVRKPVERLAFATHGSRTGKRNNGFRVTYEGMDE